MTGTRVELRIRRLELDTSARPSRAALCAAVEAELAVLLGHPMPGRRGAVPADPRLTALARHIARAVHAALRERRQEEEAVPREAGAAEAVPPGSALRAATAQGTTPQETAPDATTWEGTAPAGTATQATVPPDTFTRKAGARTP
ncbi:hypothetical protein SGLAM104S_03859 [Streptomyces glaucescens]